MFEIDFLEKVEALMNQSIKDFKPKPIEDLIQECAQSPTAYDNWAPAVSKCGVLAPATFAAPLGAELQKDIMNYSAKLSEKAQGEFDQLIVAISAMGETYGYPLFIKTSFTSNKHDWDTTCCLPSADPATVLNHIYGIIQYQAMSQNPVSPSLLIRQMIKTDPAFTAFYGSMPVTQEVRFFSTSGKSNGYQPYWPKHSIIDPSCDDWETMLSEISKISSSELRLLGKMANKVTHELGGYWSVDFLKDKDGKWWLIDMAEGHMSYKCDVGYVVLEDSVSIEP